MAIHRWVGSVPPAVVLACSRCAAAAICCCRLLLPLHACNTQPRLLKAVLINI